MAPGHKRSNTFSNFPSSRDELPDTDEEETESWQTGTVRHVSSTTKAGQVPSRRSAKTSYSTSIEKLVSRHATPSHSFPVEPTNDSQPEASGSNLLAPLQECVDATEATSGVPIIDVADFVAENEEREKRVCFTKLLKSNFFILPPSFRRPRHF